MLLVLETVFDFINYAIDDKENESIDETNNKWNISWKNIGRQYVLNKLCSESSICGLIVLYHEPR